MVVIRAVLICASLMLFLLIILPAGWCFGADSPVTRWLVRRFCGLLLRLLRVRVIHHGRHGVDRTVRLLVANHVSWLDVLVLGSIETLCFVAKLEVAHWPAVSVVARLAGTIFVDRRRRRHIPRVNAVMADRLRAGRSVLLFPEGTTHDGARRGRFFTSHLACLRTRFEREPDLPFCSVQTVGLAYSDPAAAWIGDMSLVPHVWAVLNRSSIRCVLAYEPTFRIERGYDRKQLGRVLGDQIEVLLAGRPA